MGKSCGSSQPMHMDQRPSQRIKQNLGCRLTKSGKPVSAQVPVGSVNRKKMVTKKNKQPEVAKEKFKILKDTYPNGGPDVEEGSWSQTRENVTKSSPTRSTATSAKPLKTVYTTFEVANIVAAITERHQREMTDLVEKIEQDKRHMADLDDHYRRRSETATHQQAMLEMLLKALCLNFPLTMGGTGIGDQTCVGNKDQYARKAV